MTTKCRHDPRPDFQKICPNPHLMKKPASKAKPVAYPSLVTGIGALLEESRRAVVRAANCFMTATYWEVGRRLVEFEQGGKKRAEYGDELLERLSRDLTARHGRGFSYTNLNKYRQFFLLNSRILPTASEDSQILPTLSGESSEGIRSTLSNNLDATSISATLSRNLPDDTLDLLRTSPPAFRSRGRTT